MKVCLFFCFLCLGISLVACDRQEGQANEVNVLATAAAEATHIIQRARATALMMDAQRQATALVAGSSEQSLSQSSTAEANMILPVQHTDGLSTPEPEGQATPVGTPQGTTVELISVGIGGEGLFIEVYFLAPPTVVGQWYQGNVSVTDEASGTVYSEIPVLPVVGPLFGKPVENGQVGYVMLVNAPVPLQPGTLVTVTLGEYIFEHILVV